MVTGPATWKGQEQVRQGGECWFIGRGFAIRLQETCSCMRREACKPRQRGGGAVCGFVRAGRGRGMRGGVFRRREAQEELGREGRSLKRDGHFWLVERGCKCVDPLREDRGGTRVSHQRQD